MSIAREWRALSLLIFGEISTTNRARKIIWGYIWGYLVFMKIIKFRIYSKLTVFIESYRARHFHFQYSPVTSIKPSKSAHQS